MKHAGKRLFITGIPTGGKSYLAKKLAEATDGEAVLLDDLREELSDDSRYAPFVNFFYDLDEESYYRSTSPEKQWQNLVWQSEGLWPVFLDKISGYKDTAKPVIFECVNILPHLARRDIRFPGVCIIGTTQEEILRRIQISPRWGSEPHLMELEADSFFNVERPRYKAEAEKHGYKVFESADEAFEYCLNLLK